MGGSLALALAGKVRRLIGVDPAPEAASLALQLGLVQEIVPMNAATTCDLLVLAAPVRAILGCLAAMNELIPEQGLMVLDLGSTKSAICEAMQSLPAQYDPVGGHPMCGKEVSGAAHAEASLFQEKTFILTPLERTSPQAVQTALQLIAHIGSRPLILSADIHDRLAAGASHLPYLSAVALVLAAENLQDERIWQVAASGFRDSTRLAGSDLTMMVDILMSNQAPVLDSIEWFQTALAGLAGLVQEHDEAGLRQALEKAMRRRQGLTASYRT